MERDIFNLLKDISQKGFITLERRETTNRDQAILDNKRYEKLKYLLSQGLISKINESYIITEYGYNVSQFSSWNEYLKYQKETIDKKIKKEHIDLKLSEFQVRAKYWPYFISIISLLFSIFAIFYSPIQKGKKKNISTEIHTQEENKQQNKFLTIDTFLINKKDLKSLKN